MVKQFCRQKEKEIVAGKSAELSKAARPTPGCKTTTSTKKKQWVILEDDSLLRDTEVPICHPDP